MPPPSSGLLLWFSSQSVDGASNATLSTGQRVTSWVNLGSGGINGSSASDYYAPLLKRPVGDPPQVQFTGVQSRIDLSGSAALFGFLHATGVYDIFMVARRRSSGIASTPFGSTATTAEKGLYFAVNADGTLNFILTKGVPGTPVVNHASAVTMGIGVAERLMFRGDGSNSKIGKGDWSSLENAAFTSALGAGDATNGFKVGDLSTGPSVGEGGLNFFDGDLFELLIYNRNLSGGEITTLQSYLSSVGL